jgi:type I restriction enzyme R subunit
MGKDYQSEAQLEESLLQCLRSVGYQQVVIPDEDALYAHFREILNQRNADRLKGTPLSDKEFQRALNQMIGSRSFFEIAQILRGNDTQPTGKVSIQRDDNSPLYLEFFDGRTWAANVWEVTHQLTIKGVHENRYDVIILVNGLPLVQIELKRSDVDFTQAFNQIIRYKRETQREVPILRLVQMYVVSNGYETRYFANGDGNLNSKFMFFWTNVKNDWINTLRCFAVDFLEPHRLHSVIARYTIFDSANQKMLVMRPYQIYATEAIIRQAKQHPDENGFVWHTTGSGKTITSFKAARLLSQTTDAEKVIFLIDRADLDAQTAKNFDSYLPATTGGGPALDRTDDTATLVKQLQSLDNPLIVTTIQKLSNAVKNDRYKRVLTQYHDKKVAFIEDECHRSQFGKMRKDVNHWFQNAQHFGFTGTPIFKENVGADGRTTKDLYDKKLHQYLIRDAVRDGNVLGFTVQYINTIKGKEIETEDDEQVNTINTREVYENPKRIELIAEHILLNHDRTTKSRMYNAILTVPNTRMALAYYDMFRKLDPKHRLNVTTIYTWTANEDDNEEHQGTDDATSRLGLDRVIHDYNTYYHTDFSTEDFKKYFADVSKRMKEHDSRTPDQNIDVLIVVNMFLTGFDSPKLSTLYVDRYLKWHTLLQAFSRTNRVETDSKPFGNIIAYRNLKHDTDDAIKLFSGGTGAANFLAPSYDELKGDFTDAIHKLRQVAPTIDSVNDLYNIGDEAIKGFVLAFRDVLRIYNKLRVYDDFDWDQFAPAFTNQDMKNYRGRYFAAYEQLKKNRSDKIVGSVLDDIDFEINLIQQDKIDVQYIVNLIKSIDLGSKENRDSDSQRIRHMIDNADSSELKAKSKLLKEFLDKEIPNLKPNANIGDALTKFLEESRQKDIQSFARKNKIPQELITEQMADYQFYGRADDADIMNQLGKVPDLGFLQRRDLKQAVIDFVSDAINNYTLS